MKVYISVDMEGIARRQPSRTRPDRPRPRYPASVDLMVGETNAAIEGALAAGATDILVNDSHGSMYNLLPRAIHPAARRPPGPEAVVDGRRAPGPGRRLRRRALRRLPRPGRPPDGARSRTPTRAHRSRRGSTAGRPASTASTRWRSAPGACRSASSPVTMRWPRKSRPGCRGPSGSWSRTAAGGTPRPRSTRRSPRTSSRAGAERAVRRAAAGELELLRVGPPVVIEVDYRRGCRGRLTPRSCRAPSGSATAACATPPTIRSSRIAASWPGTGWPARSTGEGGRGSCRRSRRDGRRGHAILPGMTADWGPLDTLMARAEALAGAWGARARASTTIGQERAILRLFGVSGLDRVGPPAGRGHDRSLAGRRPARPRDGHRPAVRDGPARVRPRAAAARAGRRLGRDRPRARGRAAARARPARRGRGRGGASGGAPRSSGSTRSGPSVARRSTSSARRPGRGWASPCANRMSTPRSTRPPTSSAPASTSSGSRSRSVASWPTG